MAGQKLELTWVGKNKPVKLEPRLLLEVPEKSYCAKTKHEGDIFDNMLIHGDNLLALKALEGKFAGQVKCVYIDPPFNTGAAFEHYDDGVEHSIWLGLMKKRLELIYDLLHETGSLFVHLDDNELDYCKILLDEIFNRKNFVNRIVIEARAPSAFSTVNPGVFKASEYILWYAKDKTKFNDVGGRIERVPDYAYNKWIINPEASYDKWTYCSVAEAYEKSSPNKNLSPQKALEKYNDFIVKNANRICRLASISDTGAGKQILELKQKSLENPQKMFFMKRDGDLDDVYVINGQQLIFYSKNVHNIEGRLCATKMMTNIWTDIAWEGIAKEGNVSFKKGKKPERLLKRCLELTTQKGDLVLDSFLGSGTTAAVAHKMGRRWIGIELGEHCNTHCLPRLKGIINGSDSSGISKSVDWQGGGGFRFYELAPSLIKKDAYGVSVIDSEKFDEARLAEAVCKIMGFTYKPSVEEYFIHGQSTENAYIYVTTNYMTAEHMRSISQALGSKRFLSICCKAFEDVPADCDNLNVQKIPKAILDKCEWGKDDYSLNVKNLPMADSVKAKSNVKSQQELDL